MIPVSWLKDKIREEIDVEGMCTQLAQELAESGETEVVFNLRVNVEVEWN